MALLQLGFMVWLSLEHLRKSLYSFYSAGITYTTRLETGVKNLPKFYPFQLNTIVFFFFFFSN